MTDPPLWQDPLVVIGLGLAVIAGIISGLALPTDMPPADQAAEEPAQPSVDACYVKGELPASQT